MSDQMADNTTVSLSHKRKPVSTRHISGVISSDVAIATYEYLRDNIPWEDGIKSRYGYARLAHTLDPNGPHMSIVTPLIVTAFGILDVEISKLGFIYLNYYRDGYDGTGNHTHKDTNQIIISLGGPRTLVVGKKSYITRNGDVTYFGSSIHGVPLEHSSQGRISIALFVEK